MKKYRTPAILLVLFLGFALTLGLLVRAENKAGEAASPHIAVVVYGSSSARWLSLEKGIQRACQQLDVQQPLLTVAADAEAQQTAIQRAQSEGAGGLLVAVCHSEAQRPQLEQLAATLPVVTVETGAAHTSTDQLPLVAADDAAMAQSLAGGALAAHSEVLVVAHNTQRQSVQTRLAALVQALEEGGANVQQWEPPGQEVAGPLARQLIARRPGAVVALDTETLQSAAEGVATLDNPPPVYGIGHSEAITHELQRGTIAEICFPGDFGAGYLAMMQLAKQMQLPAEPATEEVEHFLVNSQNLYDPARARLLFP